MNKRSDMLLRKILNHWVNQVHPPEYGRARLMWEAAHVPHNKIDLSVLLFRPQYKSYPSSYPNGWTQTLFAWINENSSQVRIQARLC
jgi:hypothetical protein